VTDPIQRPDADDPAISDATEQVVATWQDANPDKDPAAGADDFARMREGIADLAAGDGGDPAKG
jgi:hypothetical protein